MNKIKTSKKDMRENYYIVGAGYCSLQNLLSYQSEIAYSVRREGWACDYYDIDSVIISTGYAPLKSKNVSCDYELIKKYDDKARKITCNYELDYKVRKRKVNKFLKEFITKCKEDNQ